MSGGFGIAVSVEMAASDGIRSVSAPLEHPPTRTVRVRVRVRVRVSFLFIRWWEKSGYCSVPKRRSCSCFRFIRRVRRLRRMLLSDADSQG
jgi:hypothetical protein